MFGSPRKRESFPSQAVGCSRLIGRYWQGPFTPIGTATCGLAPAAPGWLALDGEPFECTPRLKDCRMIGSRPFCLATMEPFGLVITAADCRSLTDNASSHTVKRMVCRIPVSGASRRTVTMTSGLEPGEAGFTASGRDI